MMRLWFAPNTCARVTLTALEETGAPYEPRLVAFMAGEHRTPQFLAVNPSGKVPALETEEGVLVQNGAILLWLAETYPDAGLLPPASTAAERARIAAEIFRCSSDLHPLVTRFVMPQMVAGEADAARVRAKAAEALAFQLGAVAARLSQGAWYFGERWSALDAYLAWIWFRISGSGFSAEGLSTIEEHYRRAMDRPSARAALAREAEAEHELADRGLLFRAPFTAREESET
ncbi:glutathione S-transferase [Altererythrobacter sp. B11]|uniref:glutathione S-transferase family protein n=1 Tax=Altererythrobacter sp. B11 TaxID=2060312 RepID=UPI000DC72E56|nr:glutathione S-transferase family protein [Altererythrobacter sp. B11]BBC71807.1 glutathione S-transferase [Altererythrobacter sp. B11]